MGLLDDAIREHLELKRRRGADPGEVAREQREALEPVPRDRNAALEASEPDEDVPQTGDEIDPISGPRLGHPLANDPPTDPEPGASVEFSDDPQETAELDMQPLLSDRGATSEEPPEGDPLEWEAPSEPAHRRGAGGGDSEQVKQSEPPRPQTLHAAYDPPSRTHEQKHLWS